jgi:PAS domain S-box-containing protein
MTLQKKTVTIIGVTLCGLMGFLYFISQSMVMNGFQRIENDFVHQAVQQTSKVISERIASMDSVTNDYARWDDACKFVEDGNIEFIQSNFNLQTFVNLKINFVLIYDSEGRNLFTRAADFEKQEETVVPQSVLKHFFSDGTIFSRVLKNTSVSGLLDVPEGTLLLSAQPILDSNTEGPVRGMMVFARYLDTKEIAHLAGIVNLALAVYSINDPELPSDFQRAGKFFSENESVRIHPDSPRLISGYFMMKDVNDKDCTCVRVDLPRDITRHGRTVLFSYLYLLLGVGVVFGGIVVLWLKRSVLSRMSKLSEKVEKIGEQDDLAIRLPVSGADEVSSLATRINRMLEGLQSSKQRILGQEKRFRSLVENSSDIIFIVDRECRIRSTNNSVRRILGYDPEDMIGRDALFCVHPEDVPLMRSAFLEIFNQPELCNYECRCRHANGSWVRLDCSGRNLLDDPNVQGIIVTCHNITDRKQMEEALRLDDQRLKALLDLNQKENASFEEITDFALEEAVRLTGSQFGYLAFLDETEQTLTMHSWSRAAMAMCAMSENQTKVFNLSTAGIWAEAARHRRPIIINDYAADNSAKRGLPQGHVPMTRFLSVPVFDGKKIVALAGAANKSEDYNEADTRQLSLLMGGMWRLIQRRQNEQALWEAQQRIATLVGNLPGMAFRCRNDYEWTMEYVSLGCADLTGYRPEDLIDNRCVAFGDLIHAEDRERVWNDVQSALAAKKAYQIVYRIVAMGGAVKWVREHGQGIYDSEGNLETLEGFISDITENKLAEEMIRASEANYRAIFDAVSDAIFVHDTETGEILDVNRKMLEMYGYTREEVVGADLEMLSLDAKPSNNEERMRMIHLAAETGHQLVEWRARKKTGEGFWCEVNLKREKIGGKDRLLAVVRDITERKQAEEKARRENAKLSAMISDMQEGVVFADTNNQIVEVNEYFCRFVHCRREDILGKTIEEIHKDKNLAAVLNAIDEMRNNINAPARVVQRAVGNADVILRLQGIYRDGHYEGVLLNVINVTELVQARKEAERVSSDLAQREAALQKAYTYQQKILSTAATAIFTVDEHLHITSINQAFTAMTGYTEADVVGKRCLKLEGEPCMQHCGLFDPNRTGPIIKKQCTIQAKDGRRLTILKSADVVLDDDGKVIGGIESFVDVTELVKAREIAETANAAKGMFLANMSHEIRTPMNGIMGMTELTLDTQLMPEQREYLEMVKTSADSLLNILNDVLDFSKIEAGKLDLIPIGFNLRDSLCETVSTLGPRADAKGLELACHVLPDVPDDVIGDPGRLRQIIVNLIGNAIKFTENGEVVVHVNQESQTPDDIRLHFVVADTGIGIPTEKQKLIFDAFTQVDGSTTRKYEGTGLGLAISSQLVEMMDGKIWVESEWGKGSKFHFTIKLGRQKNSPAKPVLADVKNLHDLPVLIVDDNRTNRQILDELLIRWGMKPEQAENGRIALEKMISAKDAGQKFPLILLDANMPEMDGFTVAQRIKSDPRLAHATVMMISSAGRRGDGARCEELGISAYLTKPINQSELLQAILMTLGMSSLPEDQNRLITRHLLRESRKHLRILLVEDNPVNQKLAVRILEKWGHGVTVANNGKEAVDLVEKETFDLVLMDVQMPVMGGFEATAAIREREKITGRHLPIIAMTAHAMKGDCERTIEAGMDNYVSKPIKREVLFDVIEAVGAAEKSESHSDMDEKEKCNE